MQSFESFKIFREIFTHSNHRLNQRKIKWTLSKKGTGHSFQIVDTVNNVNGWFKCCCCCWCWKCIGKHGRGSRVLFNVFNSSRPWKLVASQLFSLTLYMTKRLNMFRQSCYCISPIFLWIGFSTEQANSFSILLHFPDRIFQIYCSCIQSFDVLVLW